MARPRLYVSRLLPAPVMKAIEERFALTAVPVADPPDRTAVANGLRDAEFALCTLTERIDEEILRGAPGLRAIANYAVGYNNIDLAAAQRRGIIVTNTPDVLTEATADLAWALLLAAARRVAEGDELVRRGAWRGWEPTQMLGAEVHGRNLGIIGLGRIGQAVARRASGFDMQVWYCRRPGHPRATQAGAGAGTWLEVSLDELLRESDFVSLHVPLTEQTHHLIGRPQFELLRPTAILINTSRGPVVDEAALVEALRAGLLAGAGLDVYEREPELHPGLRDLRTVVLLPHLGSATLSTRIRMGLMCLDNLLAVLEGRPVPNRVPPKG